MNETNLSKRAIASRANGAKSRGPITEEGKRRSSQNAIRHGLLANIVVLKDEGKHIFEEILDQHIRKFNPADDVEHDAVDEMAAAHWRIRRLWSIQTNLMNHCMESQSLQESNSPVYMDPIAAAFSELAAGKQLDRLERYETRLHRMYERSFLRLKMLQTMDPAPEPDSPQASDPPEAPQPEPPPAPELAPEIPPIPNEPTAPSAPQPAPDDFPNPISANIKPLNIPHRALPNEPKPDPYKGYPRFILPVIR